MSSYKIEVIADSSGQWCGNGVRLPTEDEAKAYARHKHASWILVRETRVLPSDDPPNYTFSHGSLHAVTP